MVCLKFIWLQLGICVLKASCYRIAFFLQSYPLAVSPASTQIPACQGLWFHPSIQDCPRLVQVAQISRKLQPQAEGFRSLLIKQLPYCVNKLSLTRFKLFLKKVYGKLAKIVILFFRKIEGSQKLSISYESFIQIGMKNRPGKGIPCLKLV